MDGAKTGAKQRSERRHKGRVVPFRVSPEEYADLKALAEREGLTLGSYIRVKAIEEPTTKKPTTRARRRPSIEAQGLSKLISDIGRVGNNVNQIARSINQGDTPLAADVRDALASLREISQRAIQLMNGNS